MLRKTLERRAENITFDVSEKIRGTLTALESRAFVSLPLAKDEKELLRSLQAIIVDVTNIQVDARIAGEKLLDIYSKYESEAK